MDKDSKNKYITWQSFAHKNQETGIWPDSYGALMSIRADSPSNGFEKAFVTFKGRLLIDEEKFWEALKNQLQREKV